MPGGRISSQGWSIDSLEKEFPNFQPVERISALGRTHSAIEMAIKEYENRGIPLIISDFHQLATWDHDLLSQEWLTENYGGLETPVRDVHTRTDNMMTLREYLVYAAEIPHFTTEDEQSRFYGKDAVCTSEWAEWLTQNDGALPPYIFPYGDGDLFRYLDDSERPETLMTYFGIGDTYTPCHKDLCASVGQNLMTYTAPGSSSFWFFTPSDSSLLVSQHFHATYGAELDFESTTLEPEDFSNFPCTVYICEQKLGDLVIVPRKSCHQAVRHQRASFSELLKERDEAVALVNNTAGRVVVQSLTKRSLANLRYNRILRAAVRLQKLRDSPSAQQTRRCSSLHKYDHSVAHTVTGVNYIFRSTYGKVFGTTVYAPIALSLSAEPNPELRLVIAATLFPHCELRGSVGLKRGYYDEVRIKSYAQRMAEKVSSRSQKLPTAAAETNGVEPSNEGSDDSLQEVKTPRPPATKRRSRPSASEVAPAGKRIKTERKKSRPSRFQEAHIPSEPDEESSSEDELGQLTPSETLFSPRKTTSALYATPQKQNPKQNPKQPQSEKSRKIAINAPNGRPSAQDDPNGLSEILLPPRRIKPPTNAHNGPVEESPNTRCSHGPDLLAILTKNLIQAMNAEREQPSIDNQFKTAAALQSLLGVHGVEEADIDTQLMIYVPQPNRPMQSIPPRQDPPSKHH
ncbi:hypothetical protein FRC02_012187 [Tulasnella sp. 418]|nr:hypothetical protein FRC02_012187 [Tulasnella sp. 418]